MLSDFAMSIRDLHIPLRLDLVRGIGHQLDQDSLAQNLLFDEAILLNRQHGLNVVLGVVKDDSVPFLSAVCGS